MNCAKKYSYIRRAFGTDYMMPEDKIYDDDDDDIYIIIITIISIKREGRFWQEPEPSRATGMALALLPPQGRHAVDFFARKFGRDRTRYLGYQRPAC